MTKSRNMIRPKWRPTDEQRELVRREFPTTKTQDIADRLGVAYHQVTKLASLMGVEKDPTWLNSNGTRTDGTKGASFRFQPGNVPWTKGKKGLHLSPHSQFKKGQKPLTWKPVGSLRLASSGYLQIKLSDTGYPPRDWVMYHRHVWEQANGAVPDGCVVCFKDGKARTEADEITLDLLECITRREHMARHTFHQYGPEIAKLVQLRGAITRQINAKAKETAE